MAIPRPAVLSVSSFVCSILQFYRFFWVSFYIDAWFLQSDVSRLVSFAAEAVAKLIMRVPRLFRWVTFLVSNEALHHSRVWGKPSPLSFHPIGLHFLISYFAFSRERG